MKKGAHGAPFVRVAVKKPCVLTYFADKETM